MKKKKRIYQLRLNFKKLEHLKKFVAEVSNLDFYARPYDAFDVIAKRGAITEKYTVERKIK